MRLKLSDSLFEELKRRCREHFGLPGEHTHEIMVREDAVPIFRGFGPAAFLTRQGRIFMDPDGYQEGPVYDATEDEVHIYLNFGAKHLKFLELLDILPPRPEHSAICDQCQGRKWRSSDVNGRDDLWCHRCTAKGWIRLT